MLQQEYDKMLSIMGSCVSNQCMLIFEEKNRNLAKIIAENRHKLQEYDSINSPFENQLEPVEVPSFIALTPSILSAFCIPKSVATAFIFLFF